MVVEVEVYWCSLGSKVSFFYVKENCDFIIKIEFFFCDICKFVGDDVFWVIFLFMILNGFFYFGLFYNVVSFFEGLFYYSYGFLSFLLFDGFI